MRHSNTEAVRFTSLGYTEVEFEIHSTINVYIYIVCVCVCVFVPSRARKILSTV